MDDKQLTPEISEETAPMKSRGWIVFSIAMLGIAAFATSSALAGSISPSVIGAYYLSAATGADEGAACTKDKAACSKEKGAKAEGAACSKDKEACSKEKAAKAEGAACPASKEAKAEGAAACPASQEAKKEEVKTEAVQVSKAE
jgi:hypothetical protein